MLEYGALSTPVALHPTRSAMVRCFQIARSRKAMFIACLVAATPAMAQTPLDPPAPYAPTDAFGVNLATGSMSLSTTPISVGPDGQGGLGYRASFETGRMNWTHSL